MTEFPNNEAAAVRTGDFMTPPLVTERTHRREIRHRKRKKHSQPSWSPCICKSPLKQQQNGYSAQWHVEHLPRRTMHWTSPSTFERIEIMLSSSLTTVKTSITERNLGNWQILNNIFLNNQQVGEEITGKNRKCLEITEIETKHTRIYRMQLKQCLEGKV